MRPKITLGVDIGGSHITCALIDLHTNTIIEQSKVRLDLDSGGDANEIIDRWLEAINSSINSVKYGFQKKIGISIPGPFQYDSGISLMKDQNKYDSLYGLNIKAIIAQKINLKQEDIRFANDATCFLLGEVLSGAARNATHAVGLTLGTGLGSARFINGAVEDADMWNSKFKDGIAEDYLSTRWFVKRYSELAGIRVANVKGLLNDLEKGNVKAVSVFKEFGQNLGEFLAKFFENGYKPQVVVLGGNISKAYYLFGSYTEKFLHGTGVDINIKQAQLGEEAALIGAANELKTHPTSLKV